MESNLIDFDVIIPVAEKNVYILHKSLPIILNNLNP